MRNVAIIDAGPIIALFNAGDRHHDHCMQGLAAFAGRIVTTWPVITEASHMLAFALSAQLALLEWLERGALQIESLTLADIRYMKARMKKYADLPMDLADASLMSVAERQGISRIFTIDQDFSTYRTLKGRALQGIL